MSSKKERLDLFLVNNGLFLSRERARRAIMAGDVTVDGVAMLKPGTIVSADSCINVKEDSIPYVSRGGLKLEKALQYFNIEPYGKVAMDVGASTGGFTDCLLKNGASRVYAIDVGYGQLAWGLRQDPRVIVMERQNIRYIEKSDIGELVDLVTIDTSFISICKFLDKVISILKEEGEIAALIKPQFEAGRDEVGKGGVVREAKTHIKVLDNIVRFVQEMDLAVGGLTYSPITGPKGNIEFLIYLLKCKRAPFDPWDIEKITRVVEDAHTEHSLYSKR